MQPEDLLVNKSNIYTQNGEDGIIAAIFKRIGTTTKVCCEFGAWDGVHFSNCRRLILQGWSALMIEGDEYRFKGLVSNYPTHPLVTCVNRYVDVGPNSVGTIVQKHNIGDLDFLSVDIDGLDYEILETLDSYPRVICIEVNAGHSPETETRLDRDVAKNNIGQPLQLFVKISEKKGYDLVCYTANAFFVRRDVVREFSLPILTSKQAYHYFLNHLSRSEKEWLYLVNLGIVNPYFQFSNPYLTDTALGIGASRAIWIKIKIIISESIRFLKHRLRNIIRV